MKFLSGAIAFSSFALGATLLPAATTLSVGTGAGGLNYILNSGAAIPFGSAVRIGTFDLSGGNDAVVRNSNVFGDVDALFKAAGEGNAGGGTVAQAGNASNSLIMNDRDGTTDAEGELTGSVTNMDDAYFTNGAPLYVWVFNNANPADASEWGIFSRAIWIDPTPPPFPPIAATNLGTSGDVSDMEALRGSVEDGVGLRLDQIPEPATMVFLVSAMAAFGLRRRR